MRGLQFIGVSFHLVLGADGATASRLTKTSKMSLSETPPVS